MGAFATVPRQRPVVVVVLENHSYSAVIGNPSMPYLNYLANKYGLAERFYANAHPSIGNYFEMTTGQIITNNDSFNTVVTADNIVRHFLTKGVTWKVYAESLPYAGYTGSDTGLYLKHHNPFAYFSDVINSSLKYNIVPFTRFAGDVANHSLPDYSFVVPNICNDGHNCSLSTADNWLKANIMPLTQSSAFQQSGLLVLTFDESYSTDTMYGGGHVATVLVGPHVIRGKKSTSFFQHQHALRTEMEALGMTTFPGAAANVTEMETFFK